MVINTLFIFAEHITSVTFQAHLWEAAQLQSKSSAPPPIENWNNVKFKIIDTNLLCYMLVCKIMKLYQNTLSVIVDKMTIFRGSCIFPRKLLDVYRWHEKTVMIMSKTWVLMVYVNVGISRMKYWIFLKAYFLTFYEYFLLIWVFKSYSIINL